MKEVLPLISLCLSVAMPLVGFAFWVSRRLTRHATTLEALGEKLTDAVASLTRALDAERQERAAGDQRLHDMLLQTKSNTKQPANGVHHDG